MKTVIAALILVTTAAMAQAPGRTITISEETVKLCEQQGGCKLVSQNHLDEVLEAGIKLGRQSCKGSI